MKTKKRYTVLVLALCLLSLCIGYHPMRIMGETRNTGLFSDGENSFFRYESSGDTLTLTACMPSGRERDLQMDRVQAEAYLTVSGGVVLVCRDRGAVTLAEVSERDSRFYFPENLRYAPDGIAVTDVGQVYAAEPGTVEIRRYEGFERERPSLTLPEKVCGMFSDRTGKRVYAVTASGVYDAETGRHLSCVTPALPVRYGGGYYTDSSGTVYTFDPEQGFRECLRTGSVGACTTEKAVFVREEDGCTVSMLDFQGQRLARYHADGVITEMAAGRSSLALLVDGRTVVFADSRDFEAEKVSVPESTEIPSEVSHESRQSQSRDSSRTERIVSSEAPVSRGEEPSLTVSSSVYEIGNGRIAGIPLGTTVAQLKKGLSYGSGVLTAIDHHGSRGAGGRLGTGWQIEISSGSETLTFETVVEGDVTGEGNSNLSDLRYLAELLESGEYPGESAAEAADLDHNGRLELQDLYLLQERISLMNG